MARSSRRRPPPPSPPRPRRPTSRRRPRSPPSLDPAFAAFDKNIASQLIGHGALAVSVAVAKNGVLIHEAAFGVANEATGEAATPAYRFRIGSNSKVLTATVVMELAEYGLVRLDEPVLGPLASRLGRRDH